MTALRGYGMNSHSYESDENVVGVPSRYPELPLPRRTHHPLNFAQEADEIPNLWDCPKCGRVAHRDETAARRASQTEDLNAPTPSPRTLAAGKTHWEMLLERRTVCRARDAPRGAPRRLPRSLRC